MWYSTGRRHRSINYWEGDTVRITNQAGAEIDSVSYDLKTRTTAYLRMAVLMVAGQSSLKSPTPWRPQ